MKLVTFQRRSRAVRGGILVGDRVLDLGRAYTRHQEVIVKNGEDTMALLDSLRGLGGSILEILQGSDDSLAHCYEIERAAHAGKLDDLLFTLEEAPLVAPLQNAPLLLHFNVHEAHAHLEARFHGVGDQPLESIWYQYPLHYYGNPHNLVGPGANVMFPEDEDLRDYELEVGVVLGESVRDASIEDAEEAILGYTIVNDWAARKLEGSLVRARMGPARARTFCTSIGPCIVTKDELPDPLSARMVARVNGKVVGEGNGSGARFNFAEMISFASEGTTLPAGTILCSGPIEVGSCLKHGTFLQPGDQVELEVAGIGTLRNKVWERPLPRIFSPKG